jgi:HlyD family secretion protein
MKVSLSMGSRPRRYVIPLALVAGLGAIGWVAMAHGPIAAPAVTVAAARTADLQPAVFGIGTVEARLSYAIGPTQAGRVLRVLVDHGDRVKSGQELAEIDPVDLDERMRSAALAAERARLSVDAAEAQLREALSRNRLAQANTQRYQDLLAKHFISREAAEARRNEADVAQAAVDVAKAGVGAAKRDQAKADAERRAVAEQRANLKLLSPSDGIVTAREAEPGTTVVAGQAVLRIIDPRTLWVRARLDQASARGVRVGEPAAIVLRSRQDTVLQGRVARVEIQSDSLTEERLVDIAFDQPPADVFVGELAEVTVRLPTVKDALVIPTAAVKRVGGQNGVWRVEDGQAKFRPVALGTQTLDGRSQLLDGLREGDAVIVYSPADLKEGTKVKAAKTL